MKFKTSVLAIITVLISFCATAQESQSTTEEYPLTISIVGASDYNDIRLIQSNLKRSVQITRLATSQASKGLVEFSGSYRGDRESLIDEIKGLAQDRFAVELSKQKGKGAAAPLNVTLRKITAETRQE